MDLAQWQRGAETQLEMSLISIERKGCVAKRFANSWARGTASVVALCHAPQKLKSNPASVEVTVLTRVNVEAGCVLTLRGEDKQSRF